MGYKSCYPYVIKIVRLVTAHDLVRVNYRIKINKSEPIIKFY